jgi:hypothetical protein
MDQPEGGRKEQMKAESVKAFGADAGPTAAGRAHPIRIAARASADAGMGVSENRTDEMRRDVARTGAVWPAESCLLFAGFISPFPGGAIESVSEKSFLRQMDSHCPSGVAKLAGCVTSCTRLI